VLPGAVPGEAVAMLPAGCAYAARCAHADNLCAEAPALVPLADGRAVACHHPLA
jgi:oligopeptide/dipeptide ABC transporter ATP-binding protein